MTEPRRPAAFKIPQEPGLQASKPVADTPRHTDPEPSAAYADPAETIAKQPRAPRAIKADTALVVPDAVDVFELEAGETADLPPPLPPARKNRLLTIFATALGGLVALAVGLWTDSLIDALFARADWLGWVGAALAALVVISAIIILARELFALSRLASMEKLKRRGADAILRDDPKAARTVVDELTALFSTRADTAAGRRALAELKGEIIDGANLVRLAETELLTPLDARATTLVLDAAKRVSLVTAVSPRALVDIAYVVFESGRLIRRVADLYGGRPGTLGFIRLARDVLAHLAVTGSIAAGDSVVQQLVGHGLAARLSAKLGEGVVNGMMTARIGLAAIESVRPLPFSAAKKPGMSDFLSALTSFTLRKSDTK